LTLVHPTGYASAYWHRQGVLSLLQGPANESWSIKHCCKVVYATIPLSTPAWDIPKGGCII
jgi:hypothetical protein